MYINRLKNKKLFIGAGGNDLEVFNSDGVICLHKMIKYFAVINVIEINIASSERYSHVLWNSYLQLFWSHTDIWRRALFATTYICK